MLKKIQLIQGVGNFTRTAAGRIDLAAVTVVYAENRSGKSTLCDVMHSLSENSPELIVNRESIPNNPNKPPKVELMFNTVGGNVTSRFEDGQWQTRAPDCSKLYVFDHSFIHRNVITGQKQERQNSESMTGFILGESNTALFTALARVNNSLRDEKKLLSGMEGQFKTHVADEVSVYVNSALPAETKEQLEAKVALYETSKQQITATRHNIGRIKQRSVLSAVGEQVDFAPVFESINSVLGTSLQNIHQSSLVSLQNHMADHVNNSAVFKDWASKGVAQIKNDCPFCGQAFSADAQSLIAAYQQAFNAEFDNFNSRVRQTLNGLRQPFIIPDTRDGLIQQHQNNMQVLELYIEPEVTENQELASLNVLLSEKHEGILKDFEIVLANSQEATRFWTPRLEQKYSTPYDPAELVSFGELNVAATSYYQSIYDYWVVAGQINDILSAYRDSLNELLLANQLTEIPKQQMQASLDLKRIELEPFCVQYKQKLEVINQLAATYKEQKLNLEQSQTLYLDTYFNSINELFRQLGSNDFEIIKVPNNRGRQVIYDLRIKFKGEDIPADRINTIFSESDRRALALCIFLAKVISLPNEERAKAILVLDDPVTSFDNERIALILNKLDELQRTIKQLIVTTHYKGMAAKTVKKFKRCVKPIKLAYGPETCAIEAVEIDDMMATEHDVAFDRIKAFANRETNDDIITTLRPFFEGEIRYRFKKQLTDLGHAKLDLSVCINALRNNGFITAELGARLSAIRDTLNTPMHEIGGGALENTRALANQVMDVVYNEL